MRHNVCSIYALRKPKTNIQILQQNVLLKHKMLIAFMRRHGHEVFAEVRAAYIEILSKVLSSHFRAYLSAIERLEVNPANINTRRKISAQGCESCSSSARALYAVHRNEEEVTTIRKMRKTWTGRRDSFASQICLGLA